MIRILYRKDIRRLLLVWGVACAVLIFSAGCSASSGSGDDPAMIVDRRPVTAVFTVRYDTAEGMQTVSRALGYLAIVISDPEVAMAARANCRLYATRGGELPEDAGFSAGIININPERPTQEPQFACVVLRDWTRADFETAAKQMKPPRVVIRFSPESKTVAFGPAGSTGA